MSKQKVWPEQVCLWMDRAILIELRTLSRARVLNFTSNGLIVSKHIRAMLFSTLKPLNYFHQEPTNHRCSPHSMAWRSRPQSKSWECCFSIKARAVCTGDDQEPQKLRSVLLTRIQKSDRPIIDKTDPNKSSREGREGAILDFKTLYKAIVMKTLWCGCRDGQTD